MCCEVLNNIRKDSECFVELACWMKGPKGMLLLLFRVTLGNQVDGVKLIDPDIVRAFKKVYPDGNCMKPSAK